jgi:hypothetical protein
MYWNLGGTNGKLHDGYEGEGLRKNGSGLLANISVTLLLSGCENKTSQSARGWPHLNMEPSSKHVPPPLPGVNEMLYRLEQNNSARIILPSLLISGLRGWSLAEPKQSNFLRTDTFLANHFCI